MPKVIVEMEFDCEEFEDMSDKEQHQTIETVLESGAESTNSYIKVKSIQVDQE
jgi:hypothetical protein